MDEILGRWGGGEGESSRYTAIPTNRIADNLAKANERLGLVTTRPSGGSELEYNDLFLKVSKGREEIFKSLRPAVSKAIDIFAANISSGSRIVTIAVSEFMSARGLKDRKQAKRELKEAGRMAAELLITYDSSRLTAQEVKEYKKRGIEAFGGNITIAKGWRLSTDGYFTIEFSEEYHKLACAYPPMLYHREIVRLNDKTSPAAYYFARKMTEQKNIERAKRKGQPVTSNAVTLSVKSLLSAAAAAIPSEEAVRASNRKFSARIVSPFERDMDALHEMGTWEYRLPGKEGGGPVSREKAANLPFAEWKGLMVCFTFKGYAEELRRREAAAQAADKGQ